jgi:hypothetical protein
MTGPNTWAELLEQFTSQDVSPKTPEDIVRDYAIKETMASLELSYLKEDPAIFYRGTQAWHDQDGNKYFDFVPCVVRPEVHYCCYGKS